MVGNYIINPNNNKPHFGFVEIKHNSRWSQISSGPIYLLQGQHFGRNRGYGVDHIWAEHEADVIKAGYSRIEDVPSYVSRIVCSGAVVHCEFAQLRGDQRLTVVRSPMGKAVLELRRPRGAEPFYSVLTAYGQNRADGTRVGTVR